MSLSALESWLRTRRGLLTLWLVTTAVAVAARHAAHGVGRRARAGTTPPTPTRSSCCATASSIFWDTYWYGGGYGAITYGFVFYWLAQYVSGALIVILVAGTLPVTFYLYVRDMWKIDDVWPAWGFALVVTLYLAHGQDPFVLALALTMGGLALLARQRPLWAALPVAVGIFSNPMGLVVVVPFMLTDFIVRPAARRRYLLFAAALAPAVVVRFGLGLAFSEPGSYLNETSQLMVFLGFALVGLALAGVNAVHPRRPFVVLFLVYAVGLRRARSSRPAARSATTSAASSWCSGCRCCSCCATRGCGGRSATASSPSSPSCCSPCCSSGPRPATSSTPSSGRRPRARTSRRRWRPPSDLYDPNYRFHVVALRRHWEALYFPEAGLPHHPRLVPAGGRHPQRPLLHALRRRRVRRLAAEHGRGSTSSRRWRGRSTRGAGERRGSSESSPAFAFVEQTGAWRIYRLVDAQPILVPDPEPPAASGGAAPAQGTIGFFGHERIIFSVTRPGTYWLKVTSSPYWELEGPGTVQPRPDRFMDLRLERSGTYTLRFEVTPAKALDVMAGRFGL